MLHKEFWGLTFLAFVVWVFVASTPTDRIENGCRPVGWAGNVVTSLTALVLPDQQRRVEKWFDKLEYGCRYMTWRLFYQEKYNAWLAQQAVGAAVPAAPTTGPGVAAPPAKSGEPVPSARPGVIPPPSKTSESAPAAGPAK